MSPVRRWQVLASLLLLFGLSGSFLGKDYVIPERRSLDLFPRDVQGYVGRHVPVSNLALRQLDLTDYLSRNYRRGDRLINVYVGYHGSQSRGSIIHSPRHCLPANGWYIVSRERVPLPGGAPDVRVNRMEVAYGNDRQVVYYWYQGRGRVVSGEYVATLYRSLDAALLSRTDEALVRFAMSYRDEDSERELREFIEAFVPLLPAHLPG